MTGFVNISSVFETDKERSISILKEVYQDQGRLLRLISDVTTKVLSENNIKGKKVLLKPNWVRHSTKAEDEICLRTHDNFLLAALEFILTKSASSVVIGDAPVQGCQWDKMIGQDFLDAVSVLSEKYHIPVLIKDFRRVTFDPKINDVVQEIKPMDSYLIFDLGKESYLEPITSAEKNLFRVTQYNPDRFVESHKPGMHKYCITKELFEADIVISLPKIKTHQKAGITAALKNIVGLNGDKDYLPHHRLGGTDMGGDCYPGKNYLRYWAELSQDAANRKKGKPEYWLWLRVSSMMWRLSNPGKVHHLAAGWYGNDTTWRMVMDLNKIVNFGKSDGTLAKTPQRLLYSLCDGIIGGQGDGPLKPDPLNLGVVCFTDNSAWLDLSMATMMGIEVEKVPLLVSAKTFMPAKKISIFFNGEKKELEDLKKYAVTALMPPGWLNYRKIAL